MAGGFSVGFTRVALSMAAINLGSAAIVRILAAQCTVPSIIQAGVRAAIEGNGEENAVLRRVRVCSVLSLAIVIVLGVQGAECDECACAEQSVRVSSAIDAHAVAVISRARSAIASMVHLCVAVESFFERSWLASRGCFVGK